VAYIVVGHMVGLRQQREMDGSWFVERHTTKRALRQEVGLPSC
jgi:hypothetical protein